MKTDSVIKTSFVMQLALVCTIAFVFTPSVSMAQCDASFGDIGHVGGSFIDQGAGACDGGIGGIGGYGGGLGSFGGGISNADCGPNGPCASKCGGPYVSIFAGAVDVGDQTVGGLELEHEEGFAVGAAIGHRLTKNFRTELEYVYRENEFDGLNAALPAIPRETLGQVLSHSGMINGYFDLPIGVGHIVPYVGAGAGVTGIDSELAQSSAGGGFTVIDFDSSFAYQWIAGVTVRTFPNAEFFAEYRFFEANDPQFELNAATREVVDAEYVTRNIFFGVRLNF